MSAPNISGRAARAWLFTVTPEERALKPHGLDAYLIHQPGVHMLWSWWFLSGCDLYESKGDPKKWGTKPAVKHGADVTHEFICFALNPETGFFAGTEPPDGWDATTHDTPSRVGKHLMTPQEFVHQERLRDSDQANEIMRLFVKAVCDGHTAADSDFRSHNIRMLQATAEHFRAGLHEVH